MQGNTIVINDIFLYSNIINTLLCYFNCLAKAFVKYRMGLKLNKFGFFKPRGEYIRYHLTQNEISSTETKLHLIID